MLVAYSRLSLCICLSVLSLTSGERIECEGPIQLEGWASLMANNGGLGLVRLDVEECLVRAPRPVANSIVNYY